MGGEHDAVPLLQRPEPTLERELLRRGLGERVSTEERCRDCGRTPLVGERVYLYSDQRLTCELCRPLRKQEPVSWQLVHASEHGSSVRIRRT